MHEPTEQSDKPQPAPPAIRSAPFKGWDAVWIERGPLSLILVPSGAAGS
jgi:hypothetical protein